MLQLLRLVDRPHPDPESGSGRVDRFLSVHECGVVGGSTHSHFSIKDRSTKRNLSRQRFSVVENLSALQEPGIVS